MQSEPACGAAPTPLTVQGCILDGEGVAATSLAATSVTVVSVGAGDATGCNFASTDLTTEIRLRAEDQREWRYFVYVPDRPLDQVQVGDQLDLSVEDPSQTVVLSRGSDLVLFTVASPTPPDLGAYGASVAVGEPYCQGSGVGCAISSHFSLLVTRGSESAQLEAGETALLGDLSVSVEALWEGMQCILDYSRYRYGGFATR